MIIDSGKDKVPFIEGLGTLRGGADADGRYRITLGEIETAFLGERSAVGDNGEGIELKVIVVMETERFMTDDAFVKFESGGFESCAAARMAGLEDRHIIFASHSVDGRE